MKRRKFRKAWITIDHPQQLAIAIFVSRSFFKTFGHKCNLIISEHAYWKNVNFRKYKKEFGLVKRFERLDYPPPSLSIFLQLVLCALLFIKFLALKKFVLDLKISRKDVIVGLSTQQMLENMIISTYPHVPSVEIVPSYVFKNNIKKINYSKYQFSVGSFIVKYMEALFGMNEVFCKYQKGIGDKYDGYPLQKYAKQLAEIYDKVLVMENGSGDIKDLSLSNATVTGYPLDFDLGRRGSHLKKKVVFLGEDYFNLDNILNEEGVERRRVFINKCLKYIRENFGKRFDLIYKPHPNETTELNKLDLSLFSVYRGTESAELFYIENRSGINSVFSVISTASRSALSAGIPSYVFYKMSPDRKTFSKEWDELLGKIPDSVLIKSFKGKPGRMVFEKRKSGTAIFSKDLSNALRGLLRID